MTKDQATKQISAYAHSYDITNTISELEQELVRYNLTFDNVICLFIYKKEDHLEISPLTSPSYDIDRIHVKKMV